MSLDDRLRAAGLNPDQALSLLAPNFRVREIFDSVMAAAKTIQNVPADPALMTEVLANAGQLAAKVLQPLRRAFGVTNVSSWYRSPALNEAVGGVENSAHLTGGAADVTFKALPGDRIVEAFLFFGSEQAPSFDQVILERRGGGSVLHCAYRPGGDNRRELLISPTGGSYAAWDRTLSHLELSGISGWLPHGLTRR